jgi:sugar fermentation stimulation protein A
VKFPSELIEGRLLRRYKRFLSDVELADGAVVTAHCANPGSMKTCMVEGERVWLSESKDPKRRLRYTWELAEVAGARIFVNPLAANKVVFEGLERGVLAELDQYDNVQKEVRFGKSRIDFMLSRGKDQCFVEVKNVTLTLGSGRAAFPDSVTERGTKHLKELIQIKRSGHRAVLLFCVSRSDARSAEAAADIDPTYADWLARAQAEGVEVLAYKCKITKRGVALHRPLPVLPSSSAGGAGR